MYDSGPTPLGVFLENGADSLERVRLLDLRGSDACVEAVLAATIPLALPCLLARCKSLQVLDLSWTNIVVVPVAILYLEKLVSLCLQGTLLTEIPAWVASLPLLR